MRETVFHEAASSLPAGWGSGRASCAGWRPAQPGNAHVRRPYKAFGDCAGGRNGPHVFRGGLPSRRQRARSAHLLPLNSSHDREKSKAQSVSSASALRTMSRSSEDTSDSRSGTPWARTWPPIAARQDAHSQDRFRDCVHISVFFQASGIGRPSKDSGFGIGLFAHFWMCQVIFGAR